MCTVAHTHMHTNGATIPYKEAVINSTPNCIHEWKAYIPGV